MKYCKNCKNSSNETGILELEDDWRCKLTKKKYRNPLGDIIIKMEKCEVKNENKNCKDYVRSWWRFWLK